MHGNSAFHQCLLLPKSSLMYRIQFEAMTHWLCAAPLYNTARASAFGELVLLRKQLLVKFLNNVLQSRLFQASTALCVRKTPYKCIPCGFAADMLLRGQQSFLSTIRAPLPQSPLRDKHRVLLVLLSPVIPPAEAS